MNRDKKTTLLCLIALVVIASLLFGLSVRQRAQHVGELGGNLAGWMTAGTNVYAANWFREGPLTLCFAMYWTPASIETPDAKRNVYISFPPGAVLPVYALAKCIGHPPTPTLLILYDLFNQYALTIVLAFIVFLAVRRIGLSAGPATAFSIVPIVFYLWLPGPFYEHVMGYFGDQAVLLPAAIYLLLELVRRGMDSAKGKRVVDVAQGLLSFYGVLTDWFFVFILFAVFLHRLIGGEFGRSPLLFVRRALLFGLPALLAVALFVLQLYHLGALDNLKQRFVQRSGMQQTTLAGLAKAPSAKRPLDYGVFLRFPLDSLFWRKHVPGAFGPAGKPVVFASLGLMIALAAMLITLRVQGAPAPPAAAQACSLTFLLLFPCFLYLAVFKEHCSFWLHSFSTLKFALPLAMLPLAVFPAAAACAVRRPAVHWIVAVLCVVLAGTYAWALGGLRQAAFNMPSVDFQEVGAFLGTHTDYQDVVVTTEAPIEDQPPQYIAYSMKLVHRVQSLGEIRALVSPIKGDYTLCLFSRKAQPAHPDERLGALAAKAFETHLSGTMELLKIRKADFEAIAGG